MAYFLIYFVCAVSPLLAVAEPLASFCSLDPELNWIGVAMMVTLGQVTGFAFLYTFGGQVIQRVQWLSNPLETLDLSRYQNAKWKITASAAVLGLPPVTLLSLARSTQLFPLTLVCRKMASSSASDSADVP